MKTEQKLIEMFQENTGIHMLDSGQKDNRHWQRNQKLKPSDFIKRQRFTIEDDELIEDTFKMLYDNVAFTPEASNWNDVWRKYLNHKENEHASELCLMEEFIKEHNQNKEYYGHEVQNSFNEETALSQVIQYGYFEVNEQVFILLQIHNGSDVRGGYTEAVVFELENEYLDYLTDGYIYEHLKELKRSKI